METQWVAPEISTHLQTQTFFMTHQMHVLALVLCYLAAMLSSCGLLSRPSTPMQRQARSVLTLTTEQQRERAETLTTSRTQEYDRVRTEFENEFRNNEILINTLKLKLKKIAQLEQTNRTLKAEIEAYPQSQVDWELFKRAVKSDTHELKKELHALSCSDM